MLRFLRLVALALLVVLLVPLIAVLLIVTLVALMVEAAYTWFYVRWRCWRTDTWCYVVCSRRRGWNEFLSNNLVPALPPGIEAVWTGERDGYRRSPLSRAVRRSGLGLQKPHLARVGALRIETRSLHQQLLPLKAFAGRDTQVQQRVRSLIEQEIGRRSDKKGTFYFFGQK